MDESQVFWEPGDCAPSVARQSPQVVWVRAGGREFFRLLARPVGVVTHWISAPHLRPKGRSMPCNGRNCRNCLEGSRQERHAYGPALRWVRNPMAHVDKGGKGGTWDPCVVDLPGDAWQEVQAQVLAMTPVNGEPRWRGAVLDMSRPGGRANNQLLVKVLEQQLTDPLPEPFDVKPILLRMWGIREKFITPPSAVAGDAERPATIPFRQKGGA